MDTELLAARPERTAAPEGNPTGIVDRLFLAHPRSVGEGYRHHSGIALRFGGALVASGAKCLVHAVFPTLFKTSASDCVRCLNAELQRRRAAADDQDYVI